MLCTETPFRCAHSGADSLPDHEEVLPRHDL